MQSMTYDNERSLFFPSIVLTSFLILAHGASSVSVPASNCYVLDNASRIIDFSKWIGHSFEFESKAYDVVLRFCKDVETRSQKGYVDFGQFDKFNYFTAGFENVDFVQRFYNGDLMNCEHTYDKLGRTAQVNIICGNCLNGRCEGTSGELGCICNITYGSACRIFIELAIPCPKPGPRVFEGFTVGFHPRSWEIVYNGMTQFGFNRAYPEFSFRTDHTHLALYMTAIASLSTLMHDPIIKVLPENGLDVRLSGSAASGNPPTTLSPTILVMDWTCQEVLDRPYEVNVTIPIDGYDPIQFYLAKTCEYKQQKDDDFRHGWAVFGVLSCIFFVSATLFCCGGFFYKTRVEHQHGIDALPGMTILSACLDTACGTNYSYSGLDKCNASEPSCGGGRPSTSSAQGTWNPKNIKYGSI